MNSLLASAALGLAAAWPASGLGWLLGGTADRLSGDPAARVRAWNRAVALPPAMLGLMIGVSALPERATAPVYEAVTAVGRVGAVGAAVDAASARALSSFDGLETTAALLISAALSGLALSVVRQWRGRRALNRIICGARPADQALSLAVRAAARRMDTGRPEVRISDEIDQPMLAGLSAPVILLPADLVAQLDIERLAPICAHELAHLKRGDNWRLLLEHLLGGLFWMAPPFRAVRARAVAAREELCDAMALEGAAPEVRRVYAQNLVAVLRTRAVPAPHSAFTGKGKPTIMRLKAITNPRGPDGMARRALLGLSTALAITAVGATSIALAQQGSPGPNRTRTQVRSTDPSQNFTINSDFIRVTNAKLDGGKLMVADGETSVYHGDVSVRGRLGENTTVLLNGKTPPAGFDPTTLAKGEIRELEVTNRQVGGKHLIVLNVVTP